MTWGDVQGGKRVYRDTWIYFIRLKLLFYLCPCVEKIKSGSYFVTQHRRSARRHVYFRNAFGFCELDGLPGVLLDAGVLDAANCLYLFLALPYVACCYTSARRTSMQKINACDKRPEHLLLGHKDILCAWWAQALCRCSSCSKEKPENAKWVAFMQKQEIKGRKQRAPNFKVQLTNNWWLK